MLIIREETGEALERKDSTAELGLTNPRQSKSSQRPHPTKHQRQQSRQNDANPTTLPHAKSHQLHNTPLKRKFMKFYYNIKFYFH